MLYQLYETQRALLSPFAEFASATSKLYNHPLSPFAHTPGAQRVSAGLDLMHRLSKEYEKPEFGITSVKVAGIDVAVQEQVAIEKPFCRLLRFKRFTDDLPMLKRIKDQPTVLVVAPLSGHHSTLLRDTVRELLKDGNCAVYAVPHMKPGGELRMASTPPIPGPMPSPAAPGCPRPPARGRRRRPARGEVAGGRDRGQGSVGSHG